MAEYVLKSQKRLNAQAVTTILNAGKEIPLRRFASKGRARWSKTVKSWQAGNIFEGEANISTNFAAEAVDISVGPIPAELSQDEPEDSPADLVLLDCPTCGNGAEGTRPAFALDALDKRTWCNNCHRSRFVRLWRCSCGVPWHCCPKHAGEPARLRARATLVNATVQGAPQAATGRASSSNAREVQRNSRRPGQWLDTPPPKRANSSGSTIVFNRKECEAVHNRGNVVNPRLLSTGLKRKFAHLCPN